MDLPRHTWRKSLERRTGEAGRRIDDRKLSVQDHAGPRPRIHQPLPSREEVLSFEVIEDTILRIQRRDGKQIVYLTKRTQTPIYEVPENLPLAEGAHIRFTVKRSVLGFKFVGVEEHTPKTPPEASVQNVPPVKLPTEASASKAQETAAQPTPTAFLPNFQLIPVEQISGTFEGLGRLDEDPELEGLVESARTQGILQPIVVMRSAGTRNVYLVVAGSRRLKAAAKAGLKDVPAIIRPYSLEEAYEFSFIENIQRKDLSDYDKGRLLKLMFSKFPQRYPNQEALAKRLGKEPAWVSRHLDVVEMKEELAKQGVSPGKLEGLTERQVRQLKTVKPEERRKILEEAPELPSARKIEEEARERGAVAAPAQTGRPREEPKLTGDKYECPVCHQHFLIVHHSVKRHSFKPVRVA